MDTTSLGRNALAELADAKRIEDHKRRVEQEKKKKFDRELQLKHQVRKSIGHPELNHHSQSHNN
jgi:hypothetical protein